MNLVQLPDDIFYRFFLYLKTTDFVKLLLVCNHELVNRMSGHGVVSRVKIHAKKWANLDFGQIHKSVLSRCRGLREISLLPHRYCTIIGFDASLINEELESLELGRLNLHPDEFKMQLSKRLPSLRHLSLVGHSSLDSTLIESLPRGLTKLRVEDSNHLTTDFAQFLPPNLTHLSLHCITNLKNEFANHLPEGLMELEIVQPFMSFDYNQITTGVFDLLPRDLSRLTINIWAWQRLSFNRLKNVPPKLVSLTMNGLESDASHHFTDFSCHLQFLSLSKCDMNDYQFVKHLPSTLRGLELLACSAPTSDCAFQSLPSSVTWFYPAFRPETVRTNWIQQLPNHGIEGLGIKTFIIGGRLMNPYSIASLPPSIEKIIIVDQLDTQQIVQALPAHVKRVSVINGRSLVKWKFPPTVTELALENAENFASEFLLKFPSIKIFKVINREDELTFTGFGSS